MGLAHRIDENQPTDSRAPRICFKLTKMDHGLMQSLRAECTRAPFGSGWQRIVAIPKTGPGHSAEPRPLFILAGGGIVLQATAIRRKRGASLSRRIGQNGNVFQHGHTKQWNPT